MSYEKQNFVKGQVLKADHLNHMEDGIAAAATGAQGPKGDKGDTVQRAIRAMLVMESAKPPRIYC